MSFHSYSPIYNLPGWKAVLEQPLEPRMAALRDPAMRAKLLEGAHSPEAGVFLRVADFSNFRIGETFSEDNRALQGRLVREIAAERGAEDFDTLLDVVLADGLRTVLWTEPPDNDAESWELRAAAWEHPDTLLGGSDAGAHLDRMCGAPYTTEFLGDCLRGRKLTSVEKAVQALSDAPARLFGLRERGRVAEGNHADLVLFDPETVGAGEVHSRKDLPGDSERLYAESRGVEGVWVNGVRIVEAGEATGALPGRILRSGRDTETVALPGR